MKDEMPSVDLSGIEALKDIKKEQDVIKQRIEKMQTMRDRVSDAVFEKVHGEYCLTLDGLNQQADPLKTKVRGQYSVLRGILAKLQEELQTVNLEKEELELRHVLGEYEDDFFDEELKNWELKNTEKQEELHQAEEMKLLFLSAVDTPEELEEEKDLTTIPVNVHQGKGEAEADAPTGEILEEVEAEDVDLDDLEELEEVSDDFASEGEGDAGLADAPDDTSLDRDSDSSAGLGFDDEEKFEEAEIYEPAPITAGDVGDLGFEMADSKAMDNSGLGDFEDDLEDDDLADDLGDDITDELGSDLSDDFGDMDVSENSIEGPPLIDMAADDTVAGSDAGITLPPPPPPIMSPDGETAPVMDSLHGDPDATMLMDPKLSDQLDADNTDGTMIISNPKIVSLNNETEGQVIVLGMGTTSVGRSPDSDIHITEDRISRKHSQIAFGPGGYALYDLNSENGTYVNGNRIREHFLSNGDIITIGTYKYLYKDR